MCLQKTMSSAVLNFSRVQTSSSPDIASCQSRLKWLDASIGCLYGSKNTAKISALENERSELRQKLLALTSSPKLDMDNGNTTVVHAPSSPGNNKYECADVETPVEPAARRGSLGGSSVLDQRANSPVQSNLGKSSGSASPRGSPSLGQRGLKSRSQSFLEGDDDDINSVLLNAKWSSDWDAKCCLSCGRHFGALRAKNNCKACGKAVCNACSKQRLPRYKTMKVCNDCYESNLNVSKVQISMRPAPRLVKTGYMYKQGQFNRTWKKRYFLFDTNGNLVYFKGTKEAGVIPLQATERIIAEDELRKTSNLRWPTMLQGCTGFGLQTRSRLFVLTAPTNTSYEDWRRLICMAAHLCWRCGHRCFPSQHGGDPKCTYIPEVSRAYHPECFRCEMCDAERTRRRQEQSSDALDETVDSPSSVSNAPPSSPLASPTTTLSRDVYDAVYAVNRGLLCTHHAQCLRPTHVIRSISEDADFGDLHSLRALSSESGGDGDNDDVATDGSGHDDTTSTASGVSAVSTEASLSPSTTPDGTAEGGDGDEHDTLDDDGADETTEGGARDSDGDSDVEADDTFLRLARADTQGTDANAPDGSFALLEDALSTDRAPGSRDFVLPMSPLGDRCTPTTPSSDVASLSPSATVARTVSHGLASADQDSAPILLTQKRINRRDLIKLLKAFVAEEAEAYTQTHRERLASIQESEPVPHRRRTRTSNSEDTLSKAGRAAQDHAAKMFLCALHGVVATTQDMSVFAKQSGGGSGGESTGTRTHADPIEKDLGGLTMDDIRFINQSSRVDEFLTQLRSGKISVDDVISAVRAEMGQAGRVQRLVLPPSVLVPKPTLTPPVEEAAPGPTVAAQGTEAEADDHLYDYASAGNIPAEDSHADTEAAEPGSTATATDGDTTATSPEPAATDAAIQRGPLEASLNAAASGETTTTPATPAGQEFDFWTYAPDKFAELRDVCNISPEDFIASFSQPPLGSLGGGASGSWVKPTHDRRFIMKSMDAGERAVLLSILEQYVDYLRHAPHSLLVRFCGLYEVKIGSRTMSFVVMQNVLSKSHQIPIHELYDLKGSNVNRRTMNKKNTLTMDTVSDKLVTRKDMDLHRPLEVGERVKLILNMQITEDVAFLNANKLMDYSLLVGIHNCCDTCEHCVERRPLEVDTDGKVRIPNILNMGVRGGGPPLESKLPQSVYFFGIIDLLQKWDGKKKMEQRLKTRVLGKDLHGISAVDPDEYAQRFQEMLTERLQ